MPQKQNKALFFGSGRKRMRGFDGEMTPSELPPAVDPVKSVEEAWKWVDGYELRNWANKARKRPLD